jgi:cell division septal protein FtsQ
MRARYQDTARWPTDTGSRLRRRANKKLKQRRALRLRLRPPDLRSLAARLAAGARKAAPLLVILLALSAAGGAAWGVWHWVSRSPRFAVDHVTVAGHARVTEAEVLAAAAVPRGANLFTTSTSAIEARLEQQPWIARARVSRKLPDGLRIDIRERQPAGVVVLGAPYLVDAEGVPFKRAAVERGEADGLPIVTGITRAAFTRRPDLGAAAVRAALAVADRYRAVTGRPALGEVHLDAKTGVTLYTLEGGTALVLGHARGGEIDERLARFDVIWASLSEEERARAKTIHLDSATRPDRVTVELADAR